MTISAIAHEGLTDESPTNHVAIIRPVWTCDFRALYIVDCIVSYCRLCSFLFKEVSGIIALGKKYLTKFQHAFNETV